MPEEIPAVPPDSRKEEGKKVSKPNASAFEKLMKVEKAEETELEKRKKKNIPQKEDLAPKASFFLHNISQTKKKTTHSIEKDKIDKNIHIKKPKLSKEKPPIIKKEEKPVPKIIKKEVPLKPKEPVKPIKKEVPPKPKEKPLKPEEPIKKEEPLTAEKPIKKEETLKTKPKAIFETFFVPKEISQVVSSKVDPVKASISKEIHPVIEQIVGTVTVMQKKGISETKIILNNPQFTSSRFYGTKITITQYQTAPDSFNITLTGPQEAVDIFNDNIEGLYNMLKAQDLGFEIGILSAEYEYRPLFKRKADIDLKKENKENK